ncbi:hypothetical protein EN816_00885 [Mesorhizobium sp. M8A.F.Ca.ET.173.01.1.1]|nr:hypothetical protein EN816_00885 [Mesorhizobium sp. M8A.F.Ca.ET.173.01.1.1]
MATKPLCSIPDCDKAAEKRGWCTAHYKRWQRHGDPTLGRSPNGAAMDFYERAVLHYRGSNCLIWPFARNENGYGVLHVSSGSALVSRRVCEEVHGPAPSAIHEAAHSCGKGHEGCVAKGHVSWKTPRSNSTDKLAHGTHNRGERHPLAKLTEDEVRAIYSDDRTPQSVIAREYGVSFVTVSDIKRGRSWKWLSLP